MGAGKIAADFNAEAWKAPEVTPDIPHGDMPGDRINIDEGHIAKVNLVFPGVMEELAKVLAANPHEKAVITVCGGSGVGKSESASVLAWYLNSLGIGAYVISGDNYPRRIPLYNDAERVSIFRNGGIRGFVASGLADAEKMQTVRRLQEQDLDAAKETVQEYPWMAAYQKAGRSALAGYLGTEKEQGFEVLSDILEQFKNGAERIWLKRMGRTDTELWYDEVDFSGISVMILEWTHGNSDGVVGVDIPILLNSTPQETADYRRKRARDGKTDSPFTTMVLELEQAKLEAAAHKAKFIITKDCRLITYAQYRELMAK